MYHDCISVVVSRFASFTENFVICCHQVTNIFCTKYDSANASSAEGPSDTAFLGGSESDSREVLAGVSCDANTPSSSRFSDHSGKSRNKSAFTGTVASFYICFGFLYDPVTGFTVVDCWNFDVVLSRDLTESLQQCPVVTM